MLLTCERLFMVIVLVNVIELGCSSIHQNRENGENSAISDELEDDNDSLEVIKLEGLLGETNMFNISNEMKGNLQEVARKKGGKGGSMMNQILPMLIIPFLISSSMIPAMLLSIKFLMIKSAIIGKVAIILMLLNFFRGRANTGGVTNHYPQDLAQEHYGYHGVEEPGVYVNKRRRKRRQLR